MALENINLQARNPERTGRADPHRDAAFDAALTGWVPAQGSGLVTRDPSGNEVCVLSDRLGS